MAQVISLPRAPIHSMIPTSPDPTPLRMLAFSVAEACLSSDPNSPMFVADQRMASGPRYIEQNGDWDEVFKAGWKEWNGGVKTVSTRKSQVVWDVSEKAKERKERGKLNLSYAITSADLIDFVEVTPTSPVSPNAYHFILPSTSHLAASIARQQESNTCKPTQSFTKRQIIHFETQSAEPSPTRSTFSGLDQTRPPPIFVPRLTAKEFVQESRKNSVEVATIGERRRSSIEPLRLAENTPTPARPARRSRLPSLQQIQQRVTVTSSLRRSGSVDALPCIRPVSPRTRSTDSIEVLTTPINENYDAPNPIRRLALQRIMNKRPVTPPSPPAVEARLSSFLRERTEGRLATVSKAYETPEKTTKPTLRVTPPSLETRPAVPPLYLGRANQVSPIKSGFSTPTESRFQTTFAHLHTPPAIVSPTSPTLSVRSAGSPTLPSITCTPAPMESADTSGSDGEGSDDGSEGSQESTLLFDGGKAESMLLFDGEAEENERFEREKRGLEMRMKLLRRKSSDA